mmetsp:Transcript_18069/g.45382  ORF Transcript_18069/g.45382 Transcript_18069/m.45382 type:complete len:254 (+) Transcript_18069:299-1060(+)
MPALVWEATRSHVECPALHEFIELHQVALCAEGRNTLELVARAVGSVCRRNDDILSNHCQDLPHRTFCILLRTGLSLTLVTGNVSGMAAVNGKFRPVHLDLHPIDEPLTQLVERSCSSRRQSAEPCVLQLCLLVSNILLLHSNHHFLPIRIILTMGNNFHFNILRDNQDRLRHDLTPWDPYAHLLHSRLYDLQPARPDIVEKLLQLLRLQLQVVQSGLAAPERSLNLLLGQILDIFQAAKQLSQQTPSHTHCS